MTALIARIVLRYIAGALVAKGIVDASAGTDLAANPDALNLATMAADYLVATLPGLIVGAATEVWYWFARKFGWAR